MKFKRLGQIYYHNNEVARGNQCPTPLVMEDRVRIFYGARNEENQSGIYYVDVDKNDPFKVLASPNDDFYTPVLFKGRVGHFDDCGVIPSQVIPAEDGMAYLLYCGVTKGDPARYRYEPGIVKIFNEKDCVGRVGGALGGDLLFGRDNKCPISNSVPFSIKHSGAYYLYFVRFRDWKKVDGQYEPGYDIYWKILGETASLQSFIYTHDAFPAIAEKNISCGRPWVYEKDGQVQMLFTYRHEEDYRDNKKNSYRLAYAQLEGDQWIWQEIEIADFAGDKMQCYPARYVIGDKEYLLFNNDFTSAIQVAIRED